MIKKLKAILNWFRNNYDKDLEMYYDFDNVLVMGIKESRW